MESQYITVLRNIYKNSRAKIKLEKEGEKFPIEKGVRQGDPLSPKIFTAVLESIFRKLDWSKKGFRINGEYLSHLRFADDIAVFAENETDLTNMLSDLAQESQNVGLSINFSKTKIISNSQENNPVIIEGQHIEYVKEYIYLGQSVSFDHHTEEEVRRRIAIAWKKYWGLKEIMKNKSVNIRIKSKLFDIAVLPCLTYACQCWSLRKSEEEMLAICQRKMERSMLGIRLSDRKTNQDIRKITKVTDVTARIRSLKWNWAGHICRMSNNKWTKKITEWIPRDCKRSRGRQRKRWADIFLERQGPTWMTKARNRQYWKKTGEAYAEEATTT